MRSLLPLAVLIAVAPAAAAVTVAPAPSALGAQPGDEIAVNGRVIDAAGILTPETKARTIEKLADYEAKTGRYLVVVTTPSLGGSSVASYGQRLFARAGLGANGRKDAIGLLIAPKEGQSWIEAGSGLADELTDIRSDQIASRVTIVHLRRGDPAGATIAAINSIIATLDCVEQGACALLDFAIAVGDAR